MNNRTKTILSIVIFIALLAVSMVLYKTLMNKSTQIIPPATVEVLPEPQEKIPAAEFTVYDKEGNEVKLSDFAGTPTVINFWASWCPPCKAEMPSFEALYKEFGSDVNFMMIDTTDGKRETKEKAEAYIAKNSYTFPVYFDTELEGMYNLEVNATPTTIFVDAEGNIVEKYIGIMNEEILRSKLEQLSDKTKTTPSTNVKN